MERVVNYSFDGKELEVIRDALKLYIENKKSNSWWQDVYAKDVEAAEGILFETSLNC